MSAPRQRIAPSILSADFSRLGEEVRDVIAAGADLIHFDVMDNHYVPNLTVGPLVCEAIKPFAKVPIDVHLMVKPVDRIVPDFARAGASIISFHPEASDHVHRTLGLIRDSGCKAGLVFNPATPLDHLDHVMEGRPHPDHVGEPVIRRPVVHRLGAREDRRSTPAHRRERARHLARGRRRHQGRQHRRGGARRGRHVRRGIRHLRREGPCGRARTPARGVEAGYNIFLGLFTSGIRISWHCADLTSIGDGTAGASALGRPSLFDREPCGDS